MPLHPIASNVIKVFKDNFKEDPLIVRAPGRVNIIGEHTDYNEGFVLPAAIDKSTFVAVGKRNDECMRLIAENFDEIFEANLSAMIPSKHWSTYIMGVADQLIKRGHTISGFNLVIQGDVPAGAGLSSSASVECSVVFALNELFQLHIPVLELIDIAQKAEHTFAGVLCGVMDQFVSILGKKDHVIKLDCRSLDYEYEPLQLTGIKIVLLNTNVKHSLASSEYNMRRIECNEGVEIIKQYEPDIKTLRDVTPAMLGYLEPRDKKIYRRCKYVVEENIRLQEACEALKKGNLSLLGKKMFATHDGLSKEYEVSCKELDFLVDQVRSIPQVLGARMMGGGFGGCTINLVKEEFVDELVTTTGNAYAQYMQQELSSYIASTEDGASLVIW